MSERKYRVLFLTLISSILLVIGMLVYLDTGEFLWLITGIVAYVFSVVYYLRKPAGIVWDETEEGGRP